MINAKKIIAATALACLLPLVSYAANVDKMTLTAAGKNTIVDSWYDDGLGTNDLTFTFKNGGVYCQDDLYGDLCELFSDYAQIYSSYQTIWNEVALTSGSTWPFYNQLKKNGPKTYSSLPDSPPSKKLRAMGKPGIILVTPK